MARMYNPNDPTGEFAKRYAQRRPTQNYRAGRGYTNSYRSSRDPVETWSFIGFGLVILLFLGMFGVSVYSLTVTDTITCTVTDKDRAANSNGGSDMRVYTSDCGTLAVGDSLLDGTWSSADTYASIDPGQVYTFDTRGIRVPLLSMFPKIVDVK